MIYYLIIIFLFLLSLKSNIKTNILEQRVFKIFTILLIIAFGGLRYEVGADWSAYKYLFETIKIEKFEDLFSFREEPLYIFLNYLIKNICDNYQFFIFVIFSITFLLKFKVINKFSPDIFLSFIIYFYTIFIIYDINGLRQGIALTFTLLSVIFILKRKIFPFLLLVLIASFFHKSAIIFFPFYYISQINFNKKTIIYFILLILIVTIPVREIFKMSSFYNSLMATQTFEHYSAYQNSDSYQVDISIFSFSVFQRLFIIGLFLFNFEKYKSVDNNLLILLRNGYIVGFVIFMLFSFSAEMAARLSFYYKVLEIFMIPIIVISFRKIDNKIIYLIIFTIFSIIGLSRLLALPEGYLLPYENIIFLK